MDLVSPEFLDHFMNPRNHGTIVEPDGTGMGGSPECDDWLLLTIRVETGGSPTSGSGAEGVRRR
jgi:nitrogen fixation NifU-like protein